MKAGDGGGDVIEVLGELPSADRASVFAHAPTGVALTTPDGVLLDVNGALAELLGIPAEQLRGRSLFDHTHPGDVTAARAVSAGLRAHPEKAVRQECRLVRGDGTPVPVQIATSWVAPQGPGP